jgi:DNA-binding transcriptional LysR family regulator
MTLNVHALTRKMDLFTLRLFLTVVEERQIRRAAMRENIAPSAATKRIRDLEEVAGLELFDRQPGGVVPSAAGEVLARHLRLLFENLDELRQELGEYSQGVRGHITVAAPGSIILQYLAHEIGEFSRNFPRVELAIRQDVNSAVVQAVACGEADVAVYLASDDLVVEALDSIPYRTDRLVALVPRGHLLSEQASVTLSDLLNEPFIGSGANTLLMTSIYAAARALGHPLEPKFTVATVEVARSLVEAGLGVTILPECMHSLEASQRVATLELDEPWALRRVRIGTRRGKTITMATRALIQQLKEPPGPASSDNGAA